VVLLAVSPSDEESGEVMEDLILLLLFSSSSTLLCVLSLDTTRPAAAEGRLEREVNVLLRVKAHDERRDVDDLLAHSDVSLSDEDASVVDALGQPQLEDLRLEAALKEVIDA